MDILEVAGDDIAEGKNGRTLVDGDDAVAARDELFSHRLPDQSGRACDKMGSCRHGILRRRHA